MADTVNGNSNRLLWWLLSTLATLVIGTGGFWMQSIQSEVKAVASIQQARGERITALETVLPYIKERLDNIDKRMERWEERRYSAPVEPPRQSRGPTNRFE